MTRNHHQRHPPGLAPGASFGPVPIGAVIAFAGRLAGDTSDGSGELTRSIEAWGWMVCDGRWLVIANYQELFTFLGHQYDDGSRTDQFRIPDYRGYFLRGVDGGAKNDPDAGGRSASGAGTAAGVGSHQRDAIRNHEHGANPTGNDTVEAAGTPASVKTAISTAGSSPVQLPPGVSASETRPLNMSVHYLIRFTVRPRQGF